jgi:hypothetical protein
MPLVTRVVGFFPGRMLHLGDDIPRGVALQWAGRRTGTFGRERGVADGPQMIPSYLGCRPSDIGQRRIRHFGFFRRTGSPIWQKVLAYILHGPAQRAVDEAGAPHRDVGRPSPTARLSDLGRHETAVHDATPTPA